MIAVVALMVWIPTCSDDPDATLRDQSASTTPAVETPLSERAQLRAERRQAIEAAKTDPTTAESARTDERARCTFFVTTTTDASRLMPFEGASVVIEAQGRAEVRGKTDEKGRLELRVAPGGLVIHITAVGRQPYVQHIGLPPRHHFHRQVDLKPGTLLHVEVRREDDDSLIEGATVRVFGGGAGPSGTCWGTSNDLAVGLSDEQGRWSFDGVDPDTASSIQVEAPGLTLERDTFFPAGARSILRVLRLRVAITVRGTVTDARGQPIPGCKVTVGPAGAEWRKGSRRPRNRVVKTDDKGRYVIPGLNPGGVYAMLCEFRERSVRADDVRPTTAGGEIVRDIRFPPARSVQFRLVRDNGTPVSDEFERTLQLFLVKFADGSDASETQVSFATPGEPVLLSLGRYRVEIDPEEEQPGFEGHIELTDTTASVLTIRTAPPTPVTGRVVDVSGNPVAGVDVEIQANSGSRFGFDTETDAEGRFRFGGAQAGEWTLRVSHRKLPDVVRHLRTPCAPQEIQLTANTFLQVRFPAEARDLKCEVTLQIPQPGANGGETTHEDESMFGNWGGDESFDGFPAGPIRLDVRIQGFLPLLMEHRVVAGVPSSVTVGPLQRGVEVSGHVVTPDGLPLRGATVTLHEDRERRRARVTDHQGRFRSFGVPSGPGSVTITARGWARVRTHFQAASSPLELTIRLQRGGRALILTRDGSGATAADVEINIQDAKGRPHRGPLRTDFRGRALVHLPAGRWRAVSGNGEPVEFQIVDEEPTTVTVIEH